MKTWSILGTALITIALVGCQDTATTPTAQTAQAAPSGDEPNWVAVLTTGPLICTSTAQTIRVDAKRGGSLSIKFGPSASFSGTWKVAGPNSWGRETQGDSPGLPDFPYQEQPVEYVDSQTIRIGGETGKYTCQPA